MILPAEVHALVEALRSEIFALRTDVSDLRRENAALRADNAALRAENAALRAENAALRAENAELRRRLDLDSTTSSKPPSSDGLKKTPRLAGSLRGRSDKASGGQRGHKGDTLRRVASPDRIVRHEAQACRHCRAALTASMQTGAETRQVFDLPERLIEVTEHQAGIYACSHCRGETRAEFPDSVISAAQYGERIKAAAVYLNIQQLIPEDRTAQALSDLFGAPLICPASVVAWVGKKAQALRQVQAFIGERVAQAKVRHLDETGFRIAGKRQWLHTTSSLAFTFYRGDDLLQRLKTFQTETLRFLTDFDVPFTNNLAEQDLRMMKVKMKISGSFRTLAGAQIFATLRSVVSTARKHGCNILQTLTANPPQIIQAFAT
jgi:transposase